MKTLKNILGVVMALVTFTTLYSCDDEVEYTPAEQPNSAQVYFPTTNSSSLSLSSSANSFEVIVARAKTEDAITVPVTATGTDGLYTVPSSVSFAQNAATTSIVITYDPEEVGFDNFSELTLTIGDEYTTDYGMSKYVVKVGIPAPWKSLGKATFIEDFVTTFFAVSNEPYAVEIQENLLQPGFYRLVNPFGAAYPFNDPGDWDESKDWFLEIHAEDPTAVYMNIQETGMTWSYGMFSVGSLAGYYISKGKTLAEVKDAGYTGTFEGGVITFPAESMLVSMADYNNGGLYTANTNGAFKVVMPGIVLADYSINVAYAGKYTNSKDQVEGVVAQITEVGEDVESIRLAVFAGNDLNAAVENIRSGNVEYTEVAGAPATVMVPFNEEPVDGRYMIVAISYAGGVSKEVAYADFKYVAPSSETWTEVSKGDYTYTLFFIDEDEQPVVDENLSLFRSNEDPTRWKIEHWGNDVDFIFTYNEQTGEVVVEEQEIGYTHPNYGTVFVSDMLSYTGDSKYGLCSFADGVFHFNLIYYVEAGNFGRGEETFALKNDVDTRALVSPFQTTTKSVSTFKELSKKKIVRNQSFLYFGR